MHGSAWAVYARSGARKCGVCALATSGAELSWWVLAVIVADRENNRLQVFTLDGDHVANWPCHRACGLTTCQDGFAWVDTTTCVRCSLGGREITDADRVNWEDRVIPRPREII